MNPFILYDNRFVDATPAATDTASGYAAANIADLRPYTFWYAASSGTKYLTVDCGSAKAADTLFILAHNLYTVGATISVECSSDNFVADTTVALSGFTVSDNRAIVKTFTTQTKRYWRLKLASTSAAAYIAVVLLGARMEFPYPPDSPYDPYGQGIEAETLKSVAGNILQSVVQYHPIEITAQFSVLLRSWVFGTYKTFWDAHGRLLKPFAWVWDYTAYPSLAYFLAMKPSTRLAGPVSMGDYVDTLVLEMQGVAEV